MSWEGDSGQQERGCSYKPLADVKAAAVGAPVDLIMSLPVVVVSLYKAFASRAMLNFGCEVVLREKGGFFFLKELC